MTHNLTVESPHSLQPWQRGWLAAFAQYASRHPAEHAVVSLFADFAATHANAAERDLAVGHLTGSAWLVDAAGTRVLLTHHRKLDRWLQLGGHADGDVDLARVALREAQEESGLTGLVVDAEIFDLDRHEIAAYIPAGSPDGPASPSAFSPDERSTARGTEPAHWHYDVRYVVRAGEDEAWVVSDESHALAWRDIASLAEDGSADASLRRMARKWLSLR